MQHAVVQLIVVGVILSWPGSSCAMDRAVTTRQATSSAPLTTNAPPPAPAATDTMVERLRSNNDEVVQATLLDALMDDNVPAALLPEFERVLRQHPHADVRVAAIEIVGAADNRAHLLPALGECLKHADEDVRGAAMTVIADTESKRALDILVAQRGSAFADVRDGAQDNLEIITEKEFTSQAQWRAWWTIARPTFTFD